MSNVSKEYRAMMLYNMKKAKKTFPGLQSEPGES